jgi:HK97 gp10 family phage protein
MARTRVKIKWDDRAIDSMLLGITGGSAKRAADVTRRRMQDNIIASGRVKTGFMLRSIDVQTVRQNMRLCELAVGSAAHYTPFQNWGTRYITGAHFIEDAIRDLTFRDFFPSSSGL